MARKVSQPAKSRKASTAAEKNWEPRLSRPPNAEEIWRIADARGLKTAEIDIKLTGRTDGGYQLARKQTAERDGSAYVRLPRPGHIIVWAEVLCISLADTLRLFGYDVAAPTALVVGHTDMQGTVHDTAPEPLQVTDVALAGCSAARILAPLPAFGLPAHATVYWTPLDGVARYISGRLCMVRRAPGDARRIAWVTDAPGVGAPCAYAYHDGAMHRTTLHTCEPVRSVAHHVGAP
jgi:hypothetical protein